MTHVYLGKSGGSYILRCEGHATGSVEMCAAVSCLCYSALGWLHNAGEGHILEESVQSGDVLIRFMGGDECETVFEFLTVAFLQLQVSDGEHIQVEIMEE